MGYNMINEIVIGLDLDSKRVFESSAVNHFSMTGRCSGPAHYDVSIRQAAVAAFVTSSLKIFLTFSSRSRNILRDGWV